LTPGVRRLNVGRPTRDFMRRLCLFLTTGLAALAVAPAALADPPGLTGEFLVASPVEVTATCSETGPSTVSWFASGEAFGPYPGTFTETGTATIGHTAPSPAQFVNGFPLTRVTSLQAFFTIDSLAGQVTGMKRLVVESDQLLGLCFDFTDRELYPGGPVVSGRFRELLCLCAFGLSYDATIKTVDGTFGDRGDTGLSLNEFQASPPGGFVPSDAFNEAFSSSGVFPVSETGHVTGGGQVDEVVFGFDAKSNGGLKGNCTVVDQASGTKVKCLDVTSYVQSGDHVTFTGHASVNGTTTMYRIDVTDLAEPGDGSDTFTIQTLSGYSAGGTLTQGNVQTHG
jgi:hypothetical protein